MASISVIIPAYNRAALIAETIQCVLRQSMPADEIIVVDDGSQDNTLEVLKSFGSRLRVISQKNAGPGAARNAGLAVASGDYVWFMDSDDLASLNKIQVQASALDLSGTDIAICPWVKCRLEPPYAYPETHVLQQRGVPLNPARAIVTDWTGLLQSALFRKSFLMRVGGFNPAPEFIVMEDQLFFAECFLAGATMIHTPECFVVYRTDGQNKLTDAGFALERRLLNWANYLLEVRRRFIEGGMDPCSWLGFRLRLWGSGQQLKNIQSPLAQRAVVQIAKALGQHSDWHYGMILKILQWQNGLRQRVFGDRSALALQAGPITRKQVVMLSDIGYQLKS